MMCMSQEWTGPGHLFSTRYDHPAQKPEHHTVCGRHLHRQILAADLEDFTAKYWSQNHHDQKPIQRAAGPTHTIVILITGGGVTWCDWQVTDLHV